MRHGGFTLIEVLVAAAVMTCGLVAVASMFSLAVRVNVSNRQMAVATALLYDKMEQFKSTTFDDPLWHDGLDYITHETRYVRVWQVSASSPRTVTVTIYTENAWTNGQTELIRATTVVSNTF